MQTSKQLNKKTADKTQVINLQEGKIPPQAIDLEEAVIGACLIDNNCVDDVLQIIKTNEVFYLEKHKLIFAAVKKLHLNNEPVDLLTVSNELKKIGVLDKAGGNYSLITLTQRINSSAHVEYHSRLLQQFYIKRAFIKVSNETIINAYDDNVDVFDLEAGLEKKLDEIKNNTTATGGNNLTISDAMDQVQQRVLHLSYQKENALTGVPTGFRVLDKITGGWQPSDLIIIAARPSMGKSALCSAFISAAAKQKMAVGVITLEMSTIQMVTRLTANNSNFHLNQLFRHGFAQHKIDDYSKTLDLVAGEIKKWPVYFNDKPGLDITDVKSQARLWKRKHNLKILIVDYLQLVSDRSHKNREQEISSVSRNLKAIAKELNIPVIALSQLSRSVETRGGDKKPILSDLRESGAIEQDADLISFIWRPNYYKIDVPLELSAAGGNTALLIKKHRNGSLADVAFWFDENKTKFVDPENRSVE
jgi:replicative DNA helicase